MTHTHCLLLTAYCFLLPLIAQWILLTTHPLLFTLLCLLHALLFSRSRILIPHSYTATAIPFIYYLSGNSVASAPISTFMCLWAIYIFPGSVHIFLPAEKADPSWEYIIRSQTHECGNWDWGPDIPFRGIFVSIFRHFFFAVYSPQNFTPKSSLIIFIQTFFSPLPFLHLPSVLPSFLLIINKYERPKVVLSRLFNCFFPDHS